MISYLCKVAGVSRSGYYKYFSSESKDLRKSREDKDILSKENGNVNTAFPFSFKSIFLSLYIFLQEYKSRWWWPYPEVYFQAEYPHSSKDDKV